VGSLAKEYAGWRIRLLDLPLSEQAQLSAGLLDEMLRVPADEQGNAWVYRWGEWYRQQLLRCELPEDAAAPYRRGGVYVLIGGAGGIGEVFSEYLIRRHGAQTIWIGRREMDEQIQAKLRRLGALGPEPWYVQADASDEQSLRNAYQQIKSRHGQIHGVVHAAIELLDKSLGQMEEARFKASLDAKVSVSVRLAQVFAGEPLDFVLFFSSLQSFSKAAGQSNYAAGCVFKDAYAHELSRSWGYTEKVMNWGYWGSVGIVASADYRERMAQQGIGSIEPEEAMRALEQLFAAPVLQLAFLKMQPPTLRTAQAAPAQIEIAEARA
jgi:NAD(P)-dependent dehydrogenase (short-subunit alcohol dehydrogenase family)